MCFYVGMGYVSTVMQGWLRVGYAGKIMPVWLRELFALGVFFDYLFFGALH
ncbi:hypothetical protein [uncultured Arcanobacterium sp.]|uniref:hypothetical protein n=1 Tax=uncultured Arcanobacterium sp. TaxID=487520 RepID=UPI00260947A5|nr:hypothetical protein [uncultured Arcanobacterium sp.]